MLVERADRVARDLMVSEVILGQFRQAGVRVIAVDSGTDLTVADDDPTKTMIRQILGAVSQFEKSVIVHMLRAARERKKRKDGRCEGRKPFGHHPGEQMVIERIRDLGANRVESVECPRRTWRTSSTKRRYQPARGANGRAPTSIRSCVPIKSRKNSRPAVDHVDRPPAGIKTRHRCRNANRQSMAGVRVGRRRVLLEDTASYCSQSRKQLSPELQFCRASGHNPHSTRRGQIAGPSPRPPDAARGGPIQAGGSLKNQT